MATTAATATTTTATTSSATTAPLQRVNLRDPSPFLPTPSQPTQPWEMWIRSFNNYLLATGIDGLPEDRKIAILIHCLGAEGERVYNTLAKTTPTTFNDACALLEAHFKPTVNVISERYQFRQLCQRRGESVAEFVANLKHAARHCEFDTLHDGLILDQFIYGTCVPRIRERLLLEPTLTLDAGIKLASQVETALSGATVLAHSSHSSTTSSVNRVQQKSQPYNKGRPNPPTQAQVQSQCQRKSNYQKQCGNCGRSGHFSRDSTCPAKGQKCNGCGKLNDFSKMCRSKSQHSASHK